MDTCVLIPPVLSLMLQPRGPAGGSRLFEMGVTLWANCELLPGMLLHPDEGEMRLDRLEIYSDLYAKDVRRLYGGYDEVLLIDKRDVRHCNWVRFVHSARSAEEVNLVARRINQRPIFQVVRRIPANGELRVHFDDLDIQDAVRSSAVVREFITNDVINRATATKEGVKTPRRARACQIDRRKFKKLKLSSELEDEDDLTGLSSTVKAASEYGGHVGVFTVKQDLSDKEDTGSTAELRFSPDAERAKTSFTPNATHRLEATENLTRRNVTASHKRACISDVSDNSQSESDDDSQDNDDVTSRDEDLVALDLSPKTSGARLVTTDVESLKRSDPIKCMTSFENQRVRNSPSLHRGCQSPMERSEDSRQNFTESATFSRISPSLAKTAHLDIQRSSGVQDPSEKAFESLAQLSRYSASQNVSKDLSHVPFQHPSQGATNHSSHAALQNYTQGALRQLLQGFSHHSSPPAGHQAAISSGKGDKVSPLGAPSGQGDQTFTSPSSGFISPTNPAFSSSGASEVTDKSSFELVTPPTAVPKNQQLHLTSCSDESNDSYNSSARSCNSPALYPHFSPSPSLAPPPPVGGAMSDGGAVTSLPVGVARRREKTWLPCDVCGKKFDRPSLLKRHMRTHTGEKPHACDVCEKAFSTSSSLNTHKRIHSGEKPHECNVCGKRFTASSNLYYHRMTHKKEKPHKCNLCAKSFPTPGDLKSHKYVHSGSWPFTCETCCRGFSKAANLKNHRLLHTGERPFHCDICGRSFGLQCNLKTHLKMHEDNPAMESCVVCGSDYSPLELEAPSSAPGRCGACASPATPRSLLAPLDLNPSVTKAGEDGTLGGRVSNASSRMERHGGIQGDKYSNKQRSSQRGNQANNRAHGHRDNSRDSHKYSERELHRDNQQSVDDRYSPVDSHRDSPSDNQGYNEAYYGKDVKQDSSNARKASAFSIDNIVGVSNVPHGLRLPPHGGVALHHVTHVGVANHHVTSQLYAVAPPFYSRLTQREQISHLMGEAVGGARAVRGGVSSGGPQESGAGFVGAWQSLYGAMKK